MQPTLQFKIQKSIFSLRYYCAWSANPFGRVSAKNTGHLYCVLYISIVYVSGVFVYLIITKLGILTMTWGFVTCGPNEALVISGKYFRQTVSHRDRATSAQGIKTLIGVNCSVLAGNLNLLDYSVVLHKIIIDFDLWIDFLRNTWIRDGALKVCDPEMVQKLQNFIVLRCLFLTCGDGYDENIPTCNKQISGF